MRLLVILGILALILPTVVAAAGDMETTMHGEVRMRGENVGNYDDFNDDDHEDSFSFAPYRVRLGVGTSFGEKVYGFAEIQVGDYFGADSPVPGVLQTNEGFPRTGELVLYQGYVKLNDVGGTSLDLKFGRQEYVQGNEFLFGDLDFYNGASLDGVRGRWDLEAGPLDIVWFRLSEDDDDPDEREAIDLIGGNFAWNDVIENGDLAVYVYSVNIEEANFGICNGAVDSDYGCQFYIIGARASQMQDGEDGFIWNAELAFETGELETNAGAGFDDTIDISGIGFEGMFGYNWETDNGTHQLFLDVYYTSGDDDPDDDNLDGFITLFQDFHRRNGAADFISGMSNLTSIGLGWEWTGEKDSVHAEYYQFTATEEGNTGIIVPEGKGYYFQSIVGSFDGIPGDFGQGIILPDGEDDLGGELDIIYKRTVNEYFGFEAGVALFMPGDAFTKQFDGAPDDDVTRVWGQARLRF